MALPKQVPLLENKPQQRAHCAQEHVLVDAERAPCEKLRVQAPVAATARPGRLIPARLVAPSAFPDAAQACQRLRFVAEEVAHQLVEGVDDVCLIGLSPGLEIEFLFVEAEREP